MKEKYSAPQCWIETFKVVDIYTTSGDPTDDNDVKFGE